MATLEKKIDEILDKVNEQNVQFATFMAHQEQHRKEIDVHTRKIETLNDLKNKLLGIVIAVASSISLIIGIVAILLKN